MVTKKRDPGTIDMFTGAVDPPVIPRSRALVAKAGKPEPATSTPSVPSVPRAPAAIELKPESPLPSLPIPTLPAAQDLALFPHGYLIVLFLAFAALGVVIGDNLFDFNIASSLIQSRAHISSRLDQYILAVVRGVPAFVIGVITLCCGVHLARRHTTAPYARMIIAGIFLAAGVKLLVVTYICERDYMWMGLVEIWRRLANLAAMQW